MFDKVVTDDIDAFSISTIIVGYYGDLSHSEIAAETGLPLGTIKSRLRLALVKLRQTMK